MRRTLFVTLSLLSLAPLSAQANVTSSSSIQGAVMAYDQARSRLVFALPSRDIWEWDGVHWAKVGAQLPQAPTKALYDASRGRVFFTAGTNLFSYDGHSVVAHGSTPATGPIVADTLRGRLVGFMMPNLNPTVVEWDGTTWQTLASVGPSRVMLQAAYDTSRQVTVAQVLRVSPVGCETYEWDGTTWTLQHTGNAGRGPLVFDATRQQVIGIGGGTWAWNGTTWTQVSTATQTQSGVFASDPAHGLVWLYFTLNGNRQVWAWDGTAWAPRLTAPHPELTEPRLSFDSIRNRAALTGVPGGGTLPGVYEWDGLAWSHNAATGPQAFSAHAQVFDPARGETIVFGGWITFGTASGDTWAWNGTTWRHAATTGPSPRAAAGITFDSARNRVVLVGGNSPPAGVLNDHWEWDGTTWTLVSANTPMLPVLGSLGYDPLRARLVFVDQTARTWEHNGVQWSMIIPSGPLPLGTPQPLQWDPTRQRLQGNLGDLTLSQRFEWDGVQWTPRFPSSGALAFDTQRGAMLNYQQLVLETNSANLASATDLGAPCGGTATPTSLSAFGRPRPGDAAFHLDVRAEAVQRPALLGFGLAAGNASLGNGCTLLLQNPLGSLIWFTDAHGFWHQPFLVPNVLALRGVSFVAQAAVLDPASPGGLAVSQGLQLVIGD